MANIVNIPGYGEVNFGDMTDEEVTKDLSAILKGAPSKAEIEKRLVGIMTARTSPPPSPVSAAIAAAGDQGPLGSVVTRNNEGKAIDAEGNVLDESQPSGPLYGAQNRGFKPRAEDFLTRTADSLSFGTLPKLSAKISELSGNGTYDENLAKRRREVDEAGERLGTAGSIAADLTGGALTGSAAANAGLSLLTRLGPRAGLLAKTGASAIEGGLYGAGSAAGHTDTGKIEDYATNAARGFKEGAIFGGTLGAGSHLLGKVITPFPADSVRRTELADTLRQEGVPVSAGEATGNEGLRRMEAQIAKTPGSQLLVGNPMHNDMERVTQQAMQRAGIGGADRATPEVITEGFQRVGGTIGRINGSTPTHLDNQTLNDAVNIMNRSQNLTQPGEIAVVRRFVDQLTSGQQLSSELAATLRTDLHEAIESAKGNPGLQRLLIDTREALDGSLERTLQQAGRRDDLAELVQARRHYANLHVLTDAIARSGSAGDRGVVTPAALANAVSSSVGKVGAVQGRGDLNELGKAVRGVKVAPSDSGTSANWGALDPARIALGAAAAPFVMNPVSQRYLGNQALPTGIPGGLLQSGVAAGGGGSGAPRLLDRYWRDAMQ